MTGTGQATTDELSDEDWAVRQMVYASTVERARPPTATETATAMGRAIADVRAAYRRLHERHELVLQADGETIRMAHPFSGVPTSFAVTAGGRRYWANCAWDTLGIAAALRVDATIDAVHTDDGTAARLRVIDGQIDGDGQVIHFRQPWRHWYDDYTFT